MLNELMIKVFVACLLVTSSFCSTGHDTDDQEHATVVSHLLNSNDGFVWGIAIFITYIGKYESCMASTAAIEYRFTALPVSDREDTTHSEPEAEDEKVDRLMFFPVLIEARDSQGRDNSDVSTIFTQYPPAMLESICRDLELVEGPTKDSEPSRVCVIPSIGSKGRQLSIERQLADYLKEVQRLQIAQFSDKQEVKGRDVWVNEDVLWPKTDERWGGLFGEGAQALANRAYAIDAMRMRSLRAELFDQRYTLPNIMRPKSSKCTTAASSYAMMTLAMFVVKLISTWVY